MNEFRTIVQPLENQQGLIDHSHPVVMLGSCFSDNVGQRLCDGLFDCIVNPCGTLYNPASIANAVLDLLYDRDYTIDDLFHLPQPRSLTGLLPQEVSDWTSPSAQVSDWTSPSAGL